MTPADRAAARVSSQVGGWLLEELVRVEGPVVSYVATRAETRAWLETLLPGTSPDPALLGRLFRGINVASMVEHPGVPRRVEDGTDEAGVPYVVTDVAEGRRLDRLTEPARPSPEEALALAAQILDVLAVVHDRGIVHAGIEPRAVIVTSDARVRLADFGQAILVSSRTRPHGAAPSPFTAPEHRLGSWADAEPRSDLYSVGATLLHCVTGQSTVAPGAALGALVGPELATLLERALADAPDARWRSAVEMAAAARWAATRCKAFVQSFAERLHQASWDIDDESTCPAGGAAPRDGVEDTATALPSSAPPALPFHPEGAALPVRLTPPAFPIPQPKDTGTLLGARKAEDVLPFLKRPGSGARPAATTILGARAMGRTLPFRPASTPAPPSSTPVREDTGTLSNAGGVPNAGLPFVRKAARSTRIPDERTTPLEPAPPPASPVPAAPEPASGAVPSAGEGGLLSVEAYAAIQAEIMLRGADEQVLQRHGLDARSWAEQQQKMTAAMDSDPNGALVNRLTAAIVAASRRLSEDK
jgi:serine/threonine-protein kinase